VVDRAVIAGPRTAAHLKELTPSASVGAQLRPGAAQLLFPDPPAISDRHIPLQCAWGAAAARLVDQLQSEPDLERRIDLLEAALLARLPRLRAVHPAITHALQLFAAGHPVTDAVDASGYSHRHFLTLFRSHIGLAPKDHCRIMRFRRAVTRLAAGEPIIDTAIRAGYADQPHLTREFRTIAGMTPAQYITAQYAAARPRHESHVPIS
jgi:AraC-like DNA-binding protein